MRGANGHCVMCKPANLMYRKRYREAGYVYVASTEERDDIVKVGYCTHTKKREQSLNNTRYGGYTGWKIIASREALEKGVLENAIHHKLKPFAFETTYFHDNQKQTASELFSVDSGYAISVLKDIDTDLSSSSAAAKSNKKLKQPHSSQQHHRKERAEQSESPASHYSELHEKPKQNPHALQIKSIREIDGRKRKETRAERRDRKSQQLLKTNKNRQRTASFYETTECYHHSKPVSKASLRPHQSDEFDYQNSKGEDDHTGLRWYHWFLIVFVMKCLFVLIHFGHLVFE
ncbi:hypothetical protein BM527_15135 [Alteromonas sp. Mex14]|nr:hypothetical protein BM527_15135 [Alteromonas sp. Mex14]